MVGARDKRAAGRRAEGGKGQSEARQRHAGRQPEPAPAPAAGGAPQAAAAARGRQRLRGGALARRQRCGGRGCTGAGQGWRVREVHGSRRSRWQSADAGSRGAQAQSCWRVSHAALTLLRRRQAGCLGAGRLTLLVLNVPAVKRGAVGVRVAMRQSVREGSERALLVFDAAVLTMQGEVGTRWSVRRGRAGRQAARCRSQRTAPHAAVHGQVTQVAEAQRGARGQAGPAGRYHNTHRAR